MTQHRNLVFLSIDPYLFLHIEFLIFAHAILIKLFCFVLFFLVLGMEPRATHLGSRWSDTGLHPLPEAGTLITHIFTN